MRQITTEEMSNIIRKIESDEYPVLEEWDSNPVAIFIGDEGQLLFQCSNRDDAERTLYAMMRVITEGGEPHG